MDITDEMVEAGTRAIHDMDCDTPECTGQLTIEGRYGRWARAAVEAAAPLIAAQALRSAAVDLSTGTYHRECSIAVVGQLRQLAHALAPDGCCPAPNMMWEHSRAGKDYFRCHGCGGGMTKARAS